MGLIEVRQINITNKKKPTMSIALQQYLLSFISEVLRFFGHCVAKKIPLINWSSQQKVDEQFRR